MAETETKKLVVIKVPDARCKEDQRKVMKTVCSVLGVDSVAMDLKNKKLTVIGEIDPVEVVRKLRKKHWYAEILTVGPPKDEKKNEPPPPPPPPPVTHHYSSVYRGEENPNPNDYGCVIC